MVTILKESKAYQYAVDCVREDNVNVGKYVKKQCQEFLDCVNSDKYYIDERSLKITEGFLQLINIMPNKSAYENLAGFQWFLIVNVFESVFCHCTFFDTISIFYIFSFYIQKNMP